MTQELLLVGTKIELKRTSKIKKVDDEASVTYVIMIKMVISLRLCRLVRAI